MRYRQKKHSYVWFNSTGYHPPRAYNEVLLGRIFPTGIRLARARRKRQFTTPGTLHWLHTALTHKLGTTWLFVYKIKITIFISVQNHTINIVETHAVDRTSTPIPMFHYNSRFSRFVLCISV